MPVWKSWIQTTIICSRLLSLQPGPHLLHGALNGFVFTVDVAIRYFDELVVNLIDSAIKCLHMIQVVMIKETRHLINPSGQAA